jgi:hypothetical protein
MYPENLRESASYCSFSPHWLQNTASGNALVPHFEQMRSGFSTLAPQVMQNFASGGRSSPHFRHLLTLRIWFPQLGQNRAS